MPAKQQPFDSAAIGARLERGLAAMRPPLPIDSGALVAPLVSYLAELNKWNAAYNLTAVRSPADMVVRHILDSLTVLPYLRGNRILDAGTGAGLPGIPLALSCPDGSSHCWIRTARKCVSCNTPLRRCAWPMSTSCRRGPKAFKPGRGYDCVVSRAFCSLAEFVANSAHLLVPGGCLLAMKGRRPDAELAMLPAGWRATAIDRVSAPAWMPSGTSWCLPRLPRERACAVDSRSFCCRCPRRGRAILKAKVHMPTRLRISR